MLEETEYIDLKEVPEEKWNNRKKKFWKKIFAESGERSPLDIRAGNCRRKPYYFYNL